MKSYEADERYEAGRLYSTDYLLKSEGLTIAELKVLVKGDKSLKYEIDKTTGKIQFLGSELNRFFSKH